MKMIFEIKHQPRKLKFHEFNALCQLTSLRVSLKHINFIDKFKPILIPQFRNATAHLTLTAQVQGLHIVTKFKNKLITRNKRPNPFGILQGIFVKS